MYGIFTYIWVIYGVNVGTYSIHGVYGNENHHFWIEFVSVKKVANILQLLPMMFPAFPSCKLPIYDDCHISFQKNY